MSKGKETKLICCKQAKTAHKVAGTHHAAEAAMAHRCEHMFRLQSFVKASGLCVDPCSGKIVLLFASPMNDFAFFV